MMLMLIGVGNLWANEVTIIANSFTATEGSMDECISYQAFKGDGTSTPAINNGNIRLYQNNNTSNGRPGGYITISAKEGCKIQKVIFKSAQKTTAGYSLDGGDIIKKNISVSADTDVPIGTDESKLNCNSISIYNYGTTKNNRLDVSYLSVTYETSGASTTYSVTYDGNSNTGGTAPADETEYSSGDEVTVLGNTGNLEKTGYSFDGWNTEADGSGNDYDADDTFTITANTTLYAQWIQNPYTVTLDDDSSTLIEVSGGAGVTLPSRNDVAGYTFAGWSITNVPTATTTAPTIIPVGSYTPTGNITLYPVYSKTEGSGGTQNKSVNVTMSEYATAHSWGSSSSSGQKIVTIDENVTATCNDGTNSGKYYTDWRIYQTETGKVTISTTSGELTSVTFTFTNSNGGTLNYGNSAITSGTAVDISGTSVEFTVGNSGSATNGQIRITSISVGYTISGGGATYYWSAPVAATVERPEIVVAENPFLFSTTATITCATEGAAIKYSFDGENWNDYTSALTITENKTIYAKAIKDENESDVAQVTATKNLAEPTVTISGDLTLDLDGETNVNAGTLTAAVTYNNAAVESATVTWSSSNTDVATIDASTGVVTIKTRGNVTFTATYAANNDYAEATGTKTITVTDSKAPGSEAKPYTVAQANEYISFLDNNVNSAEVYVKGIISGIKSIDVSKYERAQYYISDDGTSTGQLLVYNGYYIGGVKFTENDQIQVGDNVVVYGSLVNYNGTFEVAQNNKLISLTRPEKPKHNVSWSVNGKVSSTAEVEEGKSIIFPDAPEAIEGKTFVGWVAEAIDGVTDNAPTFVTSATMGTADVTYYAVFANQEGESKTATLTEAEIKGNFSNNAMGYNDDEKSYEDTADGITWAAKAYNTKDVPWIQIRKNATAAYLKISSENNIYKINLTLTNATVETGESTSDITKHGAYNGKILLLTEPAGNANEGTLGSSSEVSNNTLTVVPTSEVNELYIQTTAAARIWNVEVICGSATYSGYCTTVPKPVIARVTHCSGLDENGEEVWSSTNCTTAQEVEQHVSLTICDDFSSDEWYADRIWVYGEVNANLTLGKNQYVYISELGENANFTGKVTAAEGYIIVATDVKDDFDEIYEREHKSATLYKTVVDAAKAPVRVFDKDGNLKSGYMTLPTLYSPKLVDGDVVRLYSDCTYSSSTGRYLPANATLDLNGHTLTNTGGSGIATYSDDGGKTLTIKDSSEDKTGKITCSVANSPVLLAGVHGTLIIEGGNFEAPSNSNEGIFGTIADDAKVIISGGIFNQPVPEEFCAEGYIPTDLGEGKYSVKEGQYVAQVGDVKYETFAEAIAALTEENSTITLLADIAEAYTLAEAQSLNVNRNGHTLNVVAPAGNILKTAEADGVTTYSYVAPVAKIGEALYETLQAAFNAANEGETVTLLKDYVANEAMAGGTRQFVINKSITFDGGGYTLTTKNRGIGIGNVNGDVTENIDVTIKNITVLNTASGARCIDTRGKIGSLTLEGVTLNTQGAPSGYTQPLTIGGNQSDVANVTITSSTIQTNDNATAYYAIITFNPVNMTVTNSTIKGWANIYAKKADGSCAGSAGSVFNFDKCTLKSSNAYSNTSNAFSAFTIEDNNVTINVTNSDIVITNSGDQWQTIAGYPKDNTLSGNKVTLGEGNKVKFVEPGQFAFVINQSECSEFTVTGGLFSTVVPDEYCAEGLTTVANTDEATKDEYPYAVGVKVELAQPIIFHDGGEYEDELTVAIVGEGVKYTLNGGAEQTYSAPFTISETTKVTAWAEQDGIKSAEVSKTFTIVEAQKGPSVTDGYYNIMTNDGKYVNVAGRKTVTLVDDNEGMPGTVIRVKATDGKVETLRSQGVDVPSYAQKAMNYVPEIVQLAVDKLHAEGAGELLGETGLEKIMDKFNESFDYNLYLEKDGDAYRIYGRTPSMKPVVDFYAENKANVDAKLPELEEFINKAIQKVLQKTNGSGASVLVPFSLQTIWERMDSTLTNPADDEAKFYEEVLSSEANVWNFAYQTAMLYWGNLKNHPRFAEIQGKLGDYSKYIDKVENIRPNFRYYIVPSASGVDFISQGNSKITDASTAWTMEPVSEFKANFDVKQEHKICPTQNGGEVKTYSEYYTTLYTDFAYTLPEGVKAYKVTEITEKYGVAKREEITGVIPAQTPVLLVTSNKGAQTLTLTTEAGTAVTGNLLVGADELINQYQLKTSQVESLFNLAKDVIGESAYNEYLKKYEHLMLTNAGTVNNKYFFGLSAEDVEKCVVKNENNEEDCVIRSLSTGDEKIGFYNNWTAGANQAFLISSLNPVKLWLVGDVNRDGSISIADVTALVNIILGKAKYPDDLDKYDFDAANVNQDTQISIADVTKLVNIILGKK